MENISNYKIFDYELKNVRNFMIKFQNIDLLDNACISVTKPKFHAGAWQYIELSILDPIGPSTSQIFYDLLKKYENNVISDEFKFEIISLDPTGIEIEKWLIDVENFISFDFGELSNVGDGINNNTVVRIVVRPKDCKLMPLIYAKSI